MNAGRFDTLTKTKLTTKYGNILKVVNYESEGQEQIDYKIRTKCSICGGNICICYNYDNSDEPYDSAIEGLQKQWCCSKPLCICEYIKKDNPEKYKKLTDKFGDDVWSISEALCEEWGDYDGEDIFCDV